MLICGSDNKEDLGLLSDFEPVKTILPQLQLDLPGMLVRLCEELFLGSYVYAYIMRSYLGGLDIFLRAPEDLPATRWYHYSSRGAVADPWLWRTMPPVVFEGWLDISNFARLFAML